MSKHSFLYSNDQAGQYPPNSWYTATAHHLPPFPSLQNAETADVCIIGAGYTGLSAALHLAQQGYKVIVLEAHRVGWGASGRNGGQVGHGLNQDQFELEKNFGNEMAHCLWDMTQEAVQLCHDLIKTYQIDCDWQEGIIHATHRQRFVAEYQAYVEKLQRDYHYQAIQFLDKAVIRHEIGSEDFYGGILNKQSAHLHPLNYALGLARAARQAGVVIYENSPVKHYSNGQFVKIKTSQAQGEVTSQYLLLACNGYLDGLNSKLAARAMPINNYMIATEPLSETLAQELIRNRYAVADSRFVVNYFRLSADNRLLFGGGESYSPHFPKDIYALVQPRLLKIYPQLKDVQLDYAWGGTLAITLNRLPNFSRLAPNVLSASGYSGHGVALASLAGKLMAEAVSGSAERFDIMAKLPSYPFPGGVLLRWPLLVLAMVYYSLRDRL
ncbi:MAG: FAD-dependent oxidoreductase [Proteobacteria bacterium]|nr:MAG: FAD-dependent oxidoreductase [Pseudomonadota bacterium]